MEHTLGNTLKVRSVMNKISGVNSTMAHNIVSVTVANVLNASLTTDTDTCQERQSKSTLVTVIICVIVSLLVVLTVGGNILVLISFKINKQLQTVSNYFLLSLAIADLSIGLVSMPLYTLYLILGKWPLGPFVCDSWLSIDYTMSNASVANLLVISFDRYLSVTRPLTYRANRTPQKAMMMICVVWVISFLLWTPWIFAWPYMEGGRTTAECDCAVQFLTTNAYMSIITIIIAFYLPVIIMMVLYYKVFLETKKRQKELSYLQACKAPKKNSKFKRSVSENNSLRTQASRFAASNVPDSPSNRISVASSDISLEFLADQPKGCWQSLVHMCRIDSEEDDESSDFTNHRSSSKNKIYNQKRQLVALNSNNDQSNGHTTNDHQVHSANHTTGKNQSSAKGTSGVSFKSVSSPRQKSLDETSDKNASISSHAANNSAEESYTVLVKLPGQKTEVAESRAMKLLSDSALSKQSIQTTKDTLSNMHRGPTMLRSQGQGHLSRSHSHDPSPQAIDTLKQSVSQRKDTSTYPPTRPLHSTVRQSASNDNHQHIKSKRQEKRQESKAAKTLTAILLAFIITWTPYSICTVIRSFCPECVNEIVYNIGYWLCYINSTVNPMCYALCNTNFRQTFWRILQCKRRPIPRSQSTLYRIIQNASMADSDR